ncbi:MAG: ABC transporter permease [Patescibacteria group bacterium]
MISGYIDRLKKRYRYSLVLLRELVRTDFKLRYQDSVLGYMWSLLKPLFMFLVLYVIFVRFLKIGSNIENWPVALFLGLVLWEFFSEVTKYGLKAIVNKRGIIRKINFSKFIIMIASSMSAFINLLLNMIVVAVFIIFSDVTVTWSILLVPFFVLQLYAFALGVSLILATIYVKARDIDFIWEIVMRAGFYASAVMFPMTRILDVSELMGKLLLLNPVAQTMQDTRHALVENIPSSSELFGNTLLAATPIILSFVIFFIGAIYFKKRAPMFAEEV